jgi:hypothetical protein
MSIGMGGIEHLPFAFQVMEIVMIHSTTNQIILVGVMVMGNILMPSFEVEWG